MRKIYAILQALSVCVLLSALLFGCGSSMDQEYKRTLERVSSPPQTEYYLSEIERHLEPPAEEDASARWIEEVEKLIQAEEGQAAQHSESLYDFDSPQSMEYRGLAQDEEKMNASLAEPVNLDLLLSLAYERNQGLQSARRKVQAALEQYTQAAYLDNILSQYNAFTKQLDTKVGPQQHKEMTAMKFPFPDMLAITGSIVTQDVQMLQKDVEIALRDLITDIRLVYYEYIFIDESLGITKENQELLRQMLQVVTAKFRAGIESYGGLLKAQVELSRLSDSILNLEEKREMLIARINTLLSRPPGASLGAAMPLDHLSITVSLNDLYKLGVEHRQEIQKQKIAISKMELMIQMAEKMSTPDASMGASYFEDRGALRTGTQEMPPTFMTNRAGNPRMDVWFGKEDAYVRETEVKLDAMRQMIADMEDKTRFMVKMHHFGANNAQRTVALYDSTLLPQARQALQAVSSAYQAAKLDSLNLLDAQRTLLNFHLARLQAIWDYRNHTAQLEQTVGVTLSTASSGTE